ncbi:MAG TPA: SEC-C metal-binding domain-containing protein [Kofleriaceae bacterium]|nr:SEC-C metal-binding domain-containing protein [Kofleriaceae bacterium]
MSAAVTPDDVDRTIAAFSRLDQRGDRKAMNKLAERLQREQPYLLQYAAAARTTHGDKVGEAAVFYATLVWAMFDRHHGGTLPRLTQQNLADAELLVNQAVAAAGVEEKPIHERFAPGLAATQPAIYGKLSELIEEDVREAAMAPETATVIYPPTQVVIEAFDAALTGRRPGERQGTIVNDAPKVGRNDLCPCGSGKKYKKCHGSAGTGST